ncbi:hypothetical protein [Capnocytophaga ochracea]|jgi:hypothetical protein|uniref:hypothetical protein n=1 Tax=Capnocytophaga ochracea TaxID=1018 RepID=UPI00065FB7BB|nr:hypothetical protein [Capnocytophaga ochracea]
MKKLINVTFALLLLCSAVTLVSCGKDDDKGSGKEFPEGTREVTQNGINAKIAQERWGGNGGNTVLRVTVKLTKPDFNSKPRGKVYVQAKTTDGEVLLAWRNGVQGQGGEFGDYWIGKECEIDFSIALLNKKKMAPNSVSISKFEVYSN